MQQPRPRLPRPVGAQVSMVHQYPTTRRASLFHPVSAGPATSARHAGPGRRLGGRLDLLV